MTEFHLWGASDDRSAIIKAVLALGDYQLLPDLHYLNPNPRVYKDAEPALFEAISNKKRLYILGPYSKRPVCMEESTEGGTMGVTMFPM